MHAVSKKGDWMCHSSLLLPIPSTISIRYLVRSKAYTHTLLTNVEYFESPE